MKTKRQKHDIGLLAVGALAVLGLSYAMVGPETTAPKNGSNAVGVPLAGPKKTIVLPAPQAVEIPDVAVAIRVNRLDRVLGNIQSLVSPLAPNLTVATLMGGLGLKLDDPALAGLDQTRPILFCLFAPAGSAKPAFAALLPVPSDQYKARFEATGQLAYQKPGGKTLLLTENELASVLGRRVFDQLEVLAGRPMDSDVSVYVNAELLLARYGAALTRDINKGLLDAQRNLRTKKAPVAHPTAALAIASMEIHGILAAISDLRDLELDVSFGGTGVDLSWVLRARPDSALAAVFHDTVVPDTSVLAYVPATGAIIGYIGGDPKPFRDFLNAKLDEAIAAQPPLPGEKADPRKIKDFFLTHLTRADAVAFDLLSPGGGLQPGGVVVSRTRDTEAFLDSVRNTGRIMQESGFTEVLPMKIEFRENARTHNGVAIHHYSQEFGMPLPEMGPAEVIMRPFRQAFVNQQAELAVVNDYVISVLGGTKIEPIIDAVKAEQPLTSRPLHAQVLQPQGDFYLDVHIGRLASFVLQFVQAIVPQAAQAAARLRTLDVQPITASVATNQGMAQGKLSVPFDSIAQTVQIIMTSLAPPRPDSEAATMFLRSRKVRIVKENLRIPEARLKIPSEMQRCAANFRKVHAALVKYEKDKGQLPNWLSDLVPDYLSPDDLKCPESPGGPSAYTPDPKIPGIYTYEFSPTRLAFTAKALRGKTYREWKTQQRKVWGDIIPIVRCFGHLDKTKTVLNLAVDGTIYTSPGSWEAMLVPGYRMGMEMNE